MELEEVRNHLAMVLATNAYINICKSTDLVIAIGAVDKQVPRKPKESAIYASCVDWMCPTCGRFHRTEWKMKYCSECGQAIDWGE